MLFGVLHYLLPVVVLATAVWAFCGAFRFSRSTPRRTRRFALGAMLGIVLVTLIGGARAFAAIDRQLQAEREDNAQFQLTERIDRLGPLVVGYYLFVSSKDGGPSTINVGHWRHLGYEDFVSAPLACIFWDVVFVFIGLGARRVSKGFHPGGPPAGSTD